MFIVKSVLVVACLTAFAADVQAQLPCAKRTELITHLFGKYKEGPVSFGTANGNILVEIFASETGTFTVIATQNSGLSCIIAAGRDWQNLGLPPKNLTSL